MDYYPYRNLKVQRKHSLEEKNKQTNKQRKAPKTCRFHPPAEESNYLLCREILQRKVSLYPKTLIQATNI